MRELFLRRNGLLNRDRATPVPRRCLFAIKRKIVKIPPRPEVIRERYADFLRKQSSYLENYKRRYLDRAEQKKN